MKEKVLEIINQIRASKDLTTVLTLKASDDLRNDLDLTSFDLAELTVLSRLIVAVTVCCKSRSGDKDFLCPA